MPFTCLTKSKSIAFFFLRKILEKGYRTSIRALRLVFLFIPIRRKISLICSFTFRNVINRKKVSINKISQTPFAIENDQRAQMKGGSVRGIGINAPFAMIGLPSNKNYSRPQRRDTSVNLLLFAQSFPLNFELRKKNIMLLS